MKPLKTFVMAALAALMAMAFIGASSAMATEGTILCKADENPCSEANAVTSIHETTLAGVPATLLNSIGNVTCDVLFSGTGETTPRDATTERIEGNFTYSNCLMGKTACTVTEKNGPVSITVLKEGHETGAVTGEGEVNVKCGAFINCTYNGEGLKGTAKGPLLSSETNGSVEIANQKTTRVSGFLCPETAELDIKTTPLAATYISTRLGFCVKTEHTKGLYTDSTCKTLGKKHESVYTLVFAFPGYGSVGQSRCYHTLSGKGLWKVFAKGNVCEPKSDDASQLSLYENGEILVVE